MMLALHNLTRKITQAAKTKEIYTTKKREGFFTKTSVVWCSLSSRDHCSPLLIQSENGNDL